MNENRTAAPGGETNEETTMASCQPAGGDSRKKDRTKRWATRRWLAIASLVAFTALSAGAAVTVAPSPTDTHAAGAVTSSSTVKGPKTAASSWSMSPLPEGEGGVVSSSTQMSPVTEHSSLVAAPR